MGLRNCETCLYFLPYPHKFTCSILCTERTFDGVCRFDPHTEHKNLTMWCGKWKSGTKTKAKTTKFTKPTIAEIKEYTAEIKFELDVNDFFNHYEANGWKQGKSPIKDWKACVRTWRKKGDDVAHSKDCTDCGAKYQSHWKFYKEAKKKKYYRCDECKEVAQFK